MKRLALLSFAALMLAATVFAPVAMAQEPGDVELQSATLGTGGTVVITGTIQCTEGWLYSIYVEARQTTGNRPYNSGSWFYPDNGSGTCQTSGPETFTVNIVGSKPFKKGTVLVREQTNWCTPDASFCETRPLSDLVELRIR
jgi:hypothetical protein